MITIAFIMALCGVYLMQDKGVLTQRLLKKISSSVLLLLSAILLAIEYGTLKGLFIFIGLISMFGTVITLLLFKIPGSFTKN